MYIQEDFNTVLKTHISKNIKDFGDIPLGTLFSVIKYMNDPDGKDLEKALFIKTEPFNLSLDIPSPIKTEPFNAVAISHSGIAGLPSHFDPNEKIIVREVFAEE
jgi:hypothetical protein